MNKLNTTNDIEKGFISLNVPLSTSPSLNSSFSSKEGSFLLEELSEVQPSMHENKKWCCEKYILNLFMVGNDLSKNEYKKYNNLRRECLIKYEEDNKDHEKLLKDFYDSFLEVYKGSQPSWKTLGFQSENPRTDFRAAGFISLKFMHYFAWKYSKDLLEMIELDYFMFAVVSIRLTYMLKLFLNFVKDDELETSLSVNKIKSCTRREFKNFCFYLNYNENIFLVILSKLLIYVKKMFENQYEKEKKELNFLLIDPLLRKSINILAKFLDKSANLDILDFHLDNLLSVD